jgi:hypothetical protein
MALQRLAIAVLATATILVTGAAAQDKNELAGSIGRTFVSNQGVPGANFFDNEIHFGNGLSFEVTYGRRILGSQDSLVTLTAEVLFVVNPDQDLNFGMNVIPESYSSFFGDSSRKGEPVCQHRDLALGKFWRRFRTLQRKFQPGFLRTEYGAAGHHDRGLPAWGRPRCQGSR